MGIESINAAGSSYQGSGYSSETAPVSEVSEPKQSVNSRQAVNFQTDEADSGDNAKGLGITEDYMMAVDGQITQSEEEKFDEICMALDPDYPVKKDDIISECRNQLDKLIDEDDYYDVIQDGVEDAIIKSMKTEDSFITPKILVWDLLTIAYSDDSYDAIERKLLKYIVRKLDIDKAVFAEMESSILTLMDLEKELKWIKTTDRPYLTIEAMVNEIQDRKSVIFESVKDLIAL